MSDAVFSYVLDEPYEEEIHYLTLVSEAENGKELRFQKWLRPRHTFRLKLEAQTPALTTSIWNFYQARKGSFDTFLFQNPNENPVTAEVVGSGDGATSVFYLGNSVGIGTGDLILATGTLTLTRSIAGTGDFLAFSAYTTVDSVGQITTNAVLPTGDVLKASTYTFRYRVRFKDDSLSRENFAFNLWRFGIDLLEIL